MTVPVLVCWCFAPPKLDRVSRRRSSLCPVIPLVVLDDSNLVTDTYRLLRNKGLFAILVQFPRPYVWMP